MGTTIKFFVNKSKRNKLDNRYPIYLRVIHNLKKSEGLIRLTRIEEADFEYWDSRIQRFHTTDKKFTSYNIVLNDIQNEFHHYIRENNKILSSLRPHDIRDHLLSRTKEEVQLTLLEAINKYYEQDILQDTEKAPGTKRNYKKSVNHFSNFLIAKRYDKFSVNEFKRAHALEFVSYLKKPNKKFDKIALNGQSVNSVVKNIKPFFVKMLLEEKILTHPFLGVKTSFQRSHKPRLSNNEFQNIIDLDFSDYPVLDIYRDLFLFLCYTGLSYCDATDLRWSDIKNGYIEIQRKKSKVYTKQYLTKQTKSIIDKYKGKVPERRLLPKRSLDKMNLNLKVIAAKANIEFSVTTYTARRFFRQSIHESGIRESLVVKTLMGHTRSKDIDSHYLYIDDTILVKAKKKLQKHFKKLTR